jgi:hypothetical protein
LKGNITGDGSSKGAGIESGEGWYGKSSVWTLPIVNENITAICSYRGSRIGSGEKCEGNSSIVWNVTILNENITASNSSIGAGIGAGSGREQGISHLGILSVMGGMIRAKGTLARTGSGGEGGDVKLLKFSRNAVMTCNADLTKFPINTSSIVFTNASLIFITPRNRLFGAVLSSSNLMKLVIVYEDGVIQNNKPLLKLNATLLQIGNLTIPELNELMFCLFDMDHHDCFSIGSSIAESLIANASFVGNYSVKVFNEAMCGFLERREGVSILSVSSNRSFILECHFVADATSNPSQMTSRTVSSSQSLIAQFSASARDEQTGTFAASRAFRARIAPLRLRKRRKG